MIRAAKYFNFPASRGGSFTRIVSISSRYCLMALIPEKAASSNLRLPSLHTKNPEICLWISGFDRAIDEARTRDLHLGKVAYYQLYYYRIYN